MLYRFTPCFHTLFAVLLLLMWMPPNYRTALALQRFIFRQATENKKIKPLEIASLARAWCEIEETKRKIAGRPLAKSVDVTKLKDAMRKERVIDATMISALPPSTQTDAAPDTNAQPTSGPDAADRRAA